ncbi:MAG: SDR family NAD(P)-dependent oxidoreductase [Sandaracinaceae bacterium]
MTSGAVVVTGASGNLGRATALRLAKDGAPMVLVDRSADRLREACPEIAADPKNRIAGNVDLTDTEAVRALAAEVADDGGPVAGLVHTVGAFRGGTPVLDEEDRAWELLFAVNVRSSVAMLKAFAPSMRQAGGGSAVLVSSLDGQRASAGHAAYAASKAAVLRLTEAAAEELRDDGVRVNALVLGALDTPANRESLGADARLLPLDAVADTIAFLLSPASRAITGAAIPLIP